MDRRKPNRKRRRELLARMSAASASLRDCHDLKVGALDPASREQQIMAEMEAIRAELADGDRESGR